MSWLNVDKVTTFFKAAADQVNKKIETAKNDKQVEKVASFFKEAADQVNKKVESARLDLLAEKPIPEPQLVPGQPPWAASTDLEVGYESQLKARILELSKIQDTFLTGPPDDDELFDLQRHLPTALAVLKQDPSLDKMRFALVPRKINEKTFWRNYFYHVMEVKAQFLQMRASSERRKTNESSSPTPDSSRSERPRPLSMMSSSVPPAPPLPVGPLGSELPLKPPSTTTTPSRPPSNSPTPDHQKPSAVSRSASSSLPSKPTTVGSRTQTPVSSSPTTPRAISVTPTIPAPVAPLPPPPSSDPLQAPDQDVLEDEFEKFLEQADGDAASAEAPSTSTALEDDLFKD
mmetsp:Transcript_33365/g.54127  ORF Transcript_33365/g.54127 Transcript_33365/m.54127 type:complete len:346 (-) Transcript_33365:1476-2513(-)